MATMKDDVAIALDALDEDEQDAAIYELRKKHAEATALPAEVSSAILSGLRTLKALRSWRGLSRKQLAVVSGLPEDVIAELEDGDRENSCDEGDRLAAALSVTRSWIIP